MALKKKGRTKRTKEEAEKYYYDKYYKDYKEPTNGWFELEKDKNERIVTTFIISLISFVFLIPIHIDIIFNNSKIFFISYEKIDNLILKILFFILPIIAFYRISYHLLSSEKFIFFVNKNFRTALISFLTFLVVVVMFAFYEFNEFRKYKKQLIVLINPKLLFTSSPHTCTPVSIALGHFKKDSVECNPNYILGKIDNNLFSFLLKDEDRKKAASILEKKDNISVANNSDKKNESIGCVEGNCIDGFGKKKYSNGYYIGEFKEYKRNGQGSYVWNNGDKYIGEWKNSEEHGDGVMSFANGDKYVGKYYLGKRNGKGTYIWNDQTVHIGIYIDDKVNNGTQINPDGSKLFVFRKDGKIQAKKIQNTDQNIDLVLNQLKRNNNLQTNRMLLDISKSLMNTNRTDSSLNLQSSNFGGGFLSGSSSSGMYKTCRYSSSLGTKTKTVFASAPCPMAY